MWYCLAVEDESRPRPAKRLVRRRCDHVAELEGARGLFRYHQTRDVRHVTGIVGTSRKRFEPRKKEKVDGNALGGAAMLPQDRMDIIRVSTDTAIAACSDGTDGEPRYQGAANDCHANTSCCVRSKTEPKALIYERSITCFDWLVLRQNIVSTEPRLATMSTPPLRGANAPYHVITLPPFQLKTNLRMIISCLVPHKNALRPGLTRHVFYSYCPRGR